MRKIMFFSILIGVFSALTFLVNTANTEDGLWMYLPLNEGAGHEVADHGPNDFETELSTNCAKWTDAKHNTIQKAMEFDGKSTYVKIDMAGQKKDINSHFDDKRGITICAWVKVLEVATDTHRQTRQPIVMKGASGQWEFALYVYDDFGAGMSVWTCPGATVSETHAAGTIPQDEWVHQCGTFKLKEGVRVYVNGAKDPVAQAPDRGNGPCESGSRSVFIGHREDGQWLNAVIAEVYMWDRVISVDEMNLAMKTTGGLAVQPGSKLSTTWGHLKRR